MLGRKLARDLSGAKWRLLAIAGIIAVGMMTFVAMRSAYHNLEYARLRYYRQCRMADFWIAVKKMPLADVRAIETLPGVTAVETRIRFAATVDLPEVDEPVSCEVISLPAVRNHAINDIVLRQGDYFTAGRDNEVIVNEAFARAHRLQPGQWVHLILNNRRQELFIVGTAISSEFTYLVGPGAITPDPERYGVFYVKRRFAEETYDFAGAANELVGRLAPHVREHPDALLLAAERRLEPHGVFAATPLRLQSSNQFLTSEIDGLGAMATVIPAMFLAVAALVLNVLVTRLARQQRVVVGTLKALGYGDWQVFGHFLAFGLSVGLAGGLLGSVLGYLASTGMTYVYRWFFEFPDLRSGFYWYTHLLGLAISLACAAAGSWHAARTMLRLRPAEAMRPEPPPAGRRVWLERWTSLWSRLDSAWRMTLRTMARHRFRTLAGVLAAATGSGLLTTGFMMVSAQNFLIEFQFQRIVRSDIELSLTDERDRAALAELRALPGVDLVEPLLNVACDFEHGPYRRKGAVSGLMRGATLTRPVNTAGEAIAVPDSGLVLTRRLAEILHVDRGGTVTIVPVKGDRRPRHATVVSISDSYLGVAAYADLDFLSRLIDEPFAMNAAQLRVDPRPAAQRELFRALKELPAVEAATSRRRIVANLQEMILLNQRIFIGMLTSFAGILFFGSILNASLVNLAERQREVATLRALGYDPWRIGGVFLRESLLTNTVGALLGLPLGYGLTALTSLAYDTDLIRLPVVLEPWAMATPLLLATVFGLLAHAVVQATIHRMDFRAALQVKE